MGYATYRGYKIAADLEHRSAYSVYKVLKIISISHIQNKQPNLFIKARVLNQNRSTSQVVTHKKLEKFLRECQDGKHESSVISYQTAESLNANDKETWREIRKELEGIGITPAALEANKDFIIRWFQDAIDNGAFEEQAPDGCSKHSLVNDEFDGLSGDHDGPFPNNIATGTSSPPTFSNGQSQDLVIQNARSAELLGPERPWTPPLPPPGLNVDDEILDLLSRSMDSKLTNDDSKSHKQRRTRRASQLTTLIGRLNLRSREALYEAAAYGRLAKVKTLLKNGADVEATVEGMTPLCIAAQNGSYEIVKCLLQAGANVNAWNGAQMSIFDSTALPTRENRLQLMMDKLPEIDRIPIEQTAVHAATWNRHTKVVKLLLENGADCDTRTRSYGATALQFAADRGYKDIVDLLLEHGTDVNRVDIKGRTAVYLAACQGYNAIVTLLLENGADINRGSYKTPLHAVVRLRLTNMVHLLLDNGADINAYNQFHHTALFIAASAEMNDIVELLLKKGADPFIPSIEGRTPKQEVMKISGRPDLVKLLTTFEQTFIQNLEQSSGSTGAHCLDLDGASTEHIGIESPAQIEADALQH